MKTILVIDDDKMILNVIELALTKAGYYVETAESGNEGIQKFDNGFLDLVITDIIMPDINGNEVAKYIHNSFKKFTPVIGISGVSSVHEAVDFNVFLSKPFSMETLLYFVANLLSVVSSSVACL